MGTDVKDRVFESLDNVVENGRDFSEDDSREVAVDPACLPRTPGKGGRR